MLAFLMLSACGLDSSGSEAAGPTAIPRLSRREIDATLADVLGVHGAAMRYLPADPDLAVNPALGAEVEVFDTLHATKVPSQVFVDGLEALAFSVARDVAADADHISDLAGCEPQEPADRACLAQLTDRLGRQLWRRPLTPGETDDLVDRALELATGADGFTLAVRVVIGGLLASPQFVYRPELGDAEGQLTPEELVARLAYVLWGTAPTPELLDLAEAPLSAEALERMVDDMLADPRADEQMARFHELWLRYPALLVQDASLAADLMAESEALVDRALEPSGWEALFHATSTWATPELAEHYGLEVPDTTGWVPYDADRAGLLSHGSFLSLSRTQGDDTLVSRRGAMLARRVLCLPVLPPPPDVSVDMGVEVPAGSCKVDAYDAHATGSCVACHQVIDGIGFGFERLDGLGRPRTAEVDTPSCAISGEGSVFGESFRGPRAFAEINRDLIADCAVQNLLRYVHRDWHPPDSVTTDYTHTFVSSGLDFPTLVREVVLDPAFRVAPTEVN